MTTTYELYTNENGTPKAVEGKAPAIIERVETLETNVEALEGTLDNGVVTSVNGNTGDITPEQTGCLPLSGGKMSGPLKFSNDFISRTTTTNSMNISGGSGWRSGAYLELYGHENNDGFFQIVANNGTTQTHLKGNAGGNLTWNGNNVITSAGGTVNGELAVGGYVLAKGGYVLKGDTSGALYVMSGSGWANAGGYLTLAPRDDANGANFQLTATDGTNTSQLKGTPNGTLTWEGKEVERVNSIGTNYIRYESGLQICWGRTDNPAGSRNSSVTLPVAFKDTSYVPLAVVDSETGRFMATVATTNTASFTVGSSMHDDNYSAARTVYWYCIGKWK